MGIDFLDLFFQVEKHFGIKLEQKDLEVAALRHEKPDISADEIMEAIQAKTPGAMGVCINCNRNLRGSHWGGVCPHCGVQLDLWEALRTILAGVAGVDRETITRESLLVADLGLT